jgi:hypothetical protein
MGAEGKVVEEPPSRGWRPSFALVGKVSAVIGLIGGVLGLLFTFAPGLKPEKKESVRESANVELTDVNPRATNREYLSAEGIKTGNLSPAALSQLGVLATVRITSTGYDGKPLPLIASLTDPRTGSVVCERMTIITPGNDEPTYRSWVAYPPRAGTFNLHVTLFKPNRKPPPIGTADRSGIDAPEPNPGSLRVC